MHRNGFPAFKGRFMKTNVIPMAAIMALAGLTSFSSELYSEGKDKDILKVMTCSDFEVTGDGINPQWNRTSWTNLPQRAASPVTYLTRAKVLHSETGVYFLFDCEDNKLTATLQGDNLDLYDEDVVEVFLWTQEDFPVYFEYEISPLNFELPIMVPNYKGKFYGWLPWHYEGDRRTRHATSVRGGKKESGSEITGWMAEIFIPYKLLTPLQQVPPAPGTRWRANLYRIDYDQEQIPFSWQKTGPSFHDYQNFGTFLFE